MKLKNIAKNTALFVMVFAVILLSVFCASAEPEETLAPEVAVTEEVTVAETEAPATEAETVPETEPPVEETEPEPEPETEPETEAETEAKPEEPEEDETEATKVTYASTQAVTHNLPDATVETIPTAVAVDKDKTAGDLTYGYVSWACVIIGVLVVAIVLISNKTQYKRGNGKRRYDEGNRITGQKRLLDDDYYNHRKTESYYSKDTRK